MTERCGLELLTLLPAIAAGALVGGVGAWRLFDRRERRLEAGWRAAMRQLPRAERRRATREMSKRWAQTARRRPGRL